METIALGPKWGPLIVQCYRFFNPYNVSEWGVGLLSSKNAINVL